MNSSPMVFILLVVSFTATLEPTVLTADEPAAGNGQGSASDSTAANRAVVDSKPAAEDPADDGLPVDGLDDLDALLNIAENDVAGLAEVKVVAPALQEVVSTVSRQKSTVGRSPAAVYVITNEMIQRSGARSIPEVLRMAPGVQVQRIDANKWEISIRGFASRFSNKLLVQIDGRSVYTPLFAGVFWDVQDVLLEDVERIEVIRGPGATVWGANAVNGVINIITKHARDTQGTFVEGGVGNERGYSSARAGGQIGDNGWYRVYGKWFERDAGRGRGFAPADDWRLGHGGVRMDWDLDNSMTFTLQGDYYGGHSGNRATVPAPPPAGTRESVFEDRVQGGNVLARLSQVFDEQSDWSLQVYYDRTERVFSTAGGADNRDKIDLDFQHRSSPWEDHSLIWGIGYRFYQDNVRESPFFLTLDPAKREFDLVSGFIQDEMTLIDELLTFTAGSKFSHNDFTGFEFQPSARLLWTPDETHSIWAAASRAVRTPSRVEHDGRITLAPVAAGPMLIYPVIRGDRGFESEDLMAYEAGYREQVTQEFSWDLAVFFHDYNDIQSSRMLMPGFELPEGFVAPQVITNSRLLQTYGFELAASWQVSPCWRVFGSYSFLRGTGGSNDPRNRVYLQSSMDLTDALQFDAILRYVDGRNGTMLDDYTTMDLRLAYEVTRDIQVYVVGRNLLDGAHAEALADEFTNTEATDVEREVYAGVSLRY